MLNYKNIKFVLCSAMLIVLSTACSSAPVRMTSPFNTDDQAALARFYLLQDDTLHVSVKTANVRNEASRNAELLTQLRQGFPVKVFKKVDEWQHIAFWDVENAMFQQGWAHESLLIGKEEYDAMDPSLMADRKSSEFSVLSQLLAKYPADVQKHIRGREVEPGMSWDAVLMSWGKPSRRGRVPSKNQEHWTYCYDPQCEKKDVLLFEQGILNQF